MKPERIQSAEVSVWFGNPDGSLLRRIKQDSYLGAMGLVSAVFDAIEDHSVEPTIRLLPPGEVEIQVKVATEDDQAFVKSVDRLVAEGA